MYGALKRRIDDYVTVKAYNIEKFQGKQHYLALCERSFLGIIHLENDKYRNSLPFTFARLSHLVVVVLPLSQYGHSKCGRSLF